MDTLDNTEWDVVIAGTGLPQSLLALALSRSGKKVLHVDRNGFYGGAEAALSLQDAEEWVKLDADPQGTGSTIGQGERKIIGRDEHIEHYGMSGIPQLSFSRAYSLALAPQLIYTRSALIPTLVSSKVHTQLEFLAVGTWWICSENGLRKIPGGREDIFADKTIDLKSKRALMKFLRLAATADAKKALLEDWGSRPIEDLLTQHYEIPPQLQEFLVALTLSSKGPRDTLVSFALPRITRHLTSIGIFGPGFGSVIPKWGGLAEIAQVGCRAGAVGGGVYVLGNGVEKLISDKTSQGDSKLRLGLKTGDTVTTSWITGSSTDFPEATIEDCPRYTHMAHSIFIVSSALAQLFPPVADGAQPPAATVVVYPVGTVTRNFRENAVPIYMTIHSSDTGECPAGQCVIYSQILRGGAPGQDFLRNAVRMLLESIKEDPRPEVLWTLEYTQKHADMTPERELGKELGGDHVLAFSNSTGDLAFDDDVIREVQRCWQQITGQSEGFMAFEDRQAQEDEGEV